MIFDDSLLSIFSSTTIKHMLCFVILFLTQLAQWLFFILPIILFKVRYIFQVPDFDDGLDDGCISFALFSIFFSFPFIIFDRSRFFLSLISSSSCSCILPLMFYLICSFLIDFHFFYCFYINPCLFTDWINYAVKVCGQDCFFVAFWLYFLLYLLLHC